MPPHQPQASSLDDLPSYIPRYIYQAKHQFREIRQIELIRYRELNRALSQRNNGNRNAYVHLSQVNCRCYQERLEELNNRYGGSMPQKKYNKTHQSFTSSSQSVNASGSCRLRQPDLKSSGSRESNLRAFFNNPTSYILFSIHHSLFKKDFLEADSTERFYFFRQNLLLIMAPPAEEHGVTAGEMTKKIICWAARMNLENEITIYQNSVVTAIDDSQEKRVPDAGYGPAVAPAGLPTRRPTCVVEIGHTQSLPSLEDDAKWWLDPLKGGASVCITCKLDRTPRLVVDVWERQGSDGQEAKTRRANHIIITRLNRVNETTIRGSPFCLKFHLLFRRFPVEEEHDLVIEDDQLRAIAQKIWRHQGLV